MRASAGISSINDTFASYTLSQILGRPPSTTVNVVACLVPYLIAYLVFIPRTRPIRVALLPIGLLCAVRVCLGNVRGAYEQGTDPTSRSAHGMWAIQVCIYTVSGSSLLLFADLADIFRSSFGWVIFQFSSTLCANLA